MKTIEEQIGGRCVHFNGISNAQCGCGVIYKQAFGERPVLKMPCIKERMSHLKEEVIPCEKLQFSTAEDVKKEVDDIKKSTVLTIIALSAVKRYIKETGIKRAHIQCPNGDHKLWYQQAQVNGHVWMQCKVCEIKMME